MCWCINAGADSLFRLVQLMIIFMKLIVLMLHLIAWFLNPNRTVTSCVLTLCLFQESPSLCFFTPLLLFINQFPRQQALCCWLSISDGSCFNQCDFIAPEFNSQHLIFLRITSAEQLLYANIYKSMWTSATASAHVVAVHRGFTAVRVLQSPRPSQIHQRQNVLRWWFDPTSPHYISEQTADVIYWTSMLNPWAEQRSGRVFKSPSSEQTAVYPQV